MNRAKVTLVGAGPGDPELISVKGVKALSKADVVLYDALVHPDLLDYAPSHSTRVFVGKRAGKHSYNQTQINQLIVDYALWEGHVVRLKGGDPFVFARGKEELEYAEAFGIETAVVLGISSINLPGHYGIPLTRRGVNESFWVVTATTQNGALSKDVAVAAQSDATVVLLMGLRKLPEITSIFRKQGKADLPIAVISKGSLKDGRVVFGRIENIVEQVTQAGIETPALIVAGEAVGTHDRFYEHATELKANFLK